MSRENERKLTKAEQKELIAMVNNGEISTNQIEAFNEMTFMFNPHEVCLRVLNDAILALDASFMAKEDKEEMRKSLFAIRFFLRCIPGYE